MDNTNSSWKLFDELPEPEKTPVIPVAMDIDVEIRPRSDQSEQVHKRPQRTKKEIFVPVMDNSEKAKNFFDSLTDDKKVEQKQKREKNKAKKTPKIRKDHLPPEPEKPKKPMGRPRKYATPEEARAAKLKHDLKYARKNQTNIQISFGNKKDRAIIDCLKRQENITEYLRSLILCDISKNLGSQDKMETIATDRITHEQGEDVYMDDLEPAALIERIYLYENVLEGLGLIKRER